MLAAFKEDLKKNIKGLTNEPMKTLEAGKSFAMRNIEEMKDDIEEEIDSAKAYAMRGESVFIGYLIGKKNNRFKK